MSTYLVHFSGGPLDGEQQVLDRVNDTYLVPIPVRSEQLMESLMGMVDPRYPQTEVGVYELQPLEIERRYVYWYRGKRWQR